MKYGRFPLSEAQGAIVAHTLKLANGKPIRKGTRLTHSEIERLREEGIETVLAAKPGLQDVEENDAASQIAQALAGENIRAEPASTGRANLYAEANGLFNANRELVDRINGVDPSITLATLDNLKQVATGRMAATVKIIPYAVSRDSLNKVLLLAHSQVIGVDAYSPKRIGVASTVLPQLKTSVMDKTIRVLEQRLAISGSTITRDIRVEHDESAISSAINELLSQSDIVLVYGASAICDIDDVIPASVRALGGRIEHFGMPVDPGNLLMVGEINGKPVIGAPGCARSPAENGFDWVLQRLIAGRKVTAQEITGMGVGGLLMEIESRPQPREKIRPAPQKMAAIILAAGQSRRMGRINKLTAEIDGKTMIRHVAESALSSTADPVIVVTGHDSAAIHQALDGLNVVFVHNQAYEAGLSSSLAAGISGIPNDCDGAIILLGDMPMIESAMIDRMINAFTEEKGRAIILATFNGKRGNPVLWPRQFFERLQGISGDVGARHILGENTELVRTVELGEAASKDIDTPEALKELMAGTA
jgi:molybdenum cofactor cytidylyltransferase